MIEIIPAIDIIDGKCVRLSEGKYDTAKIYSDSPLEMAKLMEGKGVKRLHLVDLDGAKAGVVKNFTILEQICTSTKLKVDFGGGIKSDADVEQVLNAGACMVTIGSIAVKQPELVQKWISVYGKEKLFLGADVKNEIVMINGWLQKTEWNIFEFIKTYLEKGVTNVFCTDIAKDGMLQGPSLNLYERIIKQFPSINLCASGGVHAIADVEQLQSIGCKAVIIGKALYENKISWQQLQPFLI